jgi:hypothetical protein
LCSDVGVVIKASAARHLDALLADLRSRSSAARDAAVARLTVVGSGAVMPLAALVRSDDTPVARVAALKALEAIGDERGIPAVLQAVDDEDETVAAAAATAAGAFLRSSRGDAVVDRLTTAALNPTRRASLRAAAILALRGLEASTFAPLAAALRLDPVDIVRTAVGSPTGDESAPDLDAVAELTRAAIDGLSDDPLALRTTIVNARSDVTLAALARILERIRERERAAAPDRRGEWVAARGAVHVALASRGSRLGLYDLRETLERATSALAADFVEALTLVGDRECLESIAAAHARARGSRATQEAWRFQLAETFREIAARERLTRRHAVMKKIEKRWPDALRQLASSRYGSPIQQTRSAAGRR